MKGHINRVLPFALLMTLVASSFALTTSAVPAAEQSAGVPAAIGQPAPSFTLTDTMGRKHSLADSAGKFVVLEWVNFDCPFVRKHYDSNSMQKLQKALTAKGVVWYSICSSAEGRQGNYAPEKINELLKQQNAVPTAYLLDTDGNAGHAYGAKTTPHMYVVNPKGVLVYMGAIDSNPSTDITETKNPVNYVQKALDEAMSGKAVSLSSTKSYGCSIKYKQ